MADVILDPMTWEAVEAGPEAFIEQWLVAEGDHVRGGQVLAQARLVHTAVAVTAPHGGTLEQIVVAAGEKFGQGTVLARVATH